MPESSPAADDLASQILALVGHEGSGERLSSPGDLFARATKKQLLDCAAALGMKGVAKLSREDLAGRIEVAFAGLRASPVDAGAAPLNGGGSFPQKFDLGPTTEAGPMPKDIPWGYGYDRITAMAVDPMRLYVYWEATDGAIAAARHDLGSAGERAWLNIRVYDITGRLFDGTNAHSYFDHRIERHERQWFFGINKPTSTTCAEIGLKSEEGYFVKIVRSGRVEFPRNEPSPDGTVEWLSVRTASGPVGNRFAGAPGARGVGAGPGPGGGAPGGPPPGGANPDTGWEETHDWSQFAGFPVPRGQRLFGRTWQRHEMVGEEWSAETRTEWVGPTLRAEWESGPFTYPVDVPESTVEVFDNGEVAVRTEGGRTHVSYGPWQVIIRGVGARAERRVLGTWEYRRQVAVEGGMERITTGAGHAVGSSEWMMLGASERAWAGASEILLRGASELWLLGASELVYGGASERMFLGASELRFRGASERRFAGASELRMGGASERSLMGASESRLGGASERGFGGGSERLGGASERSGGGAGVTYEYDPSSPYPIPRRQGEGK